ncbi:cytochrome P450 reductase 2 [Corynespora cassiicola Philippines]|uniref:NADPH--cytochrome P450 reductase n=1 Tax=Corynespora cassiicola Philippines TaxID=1448308 RepID=A0A2T2NJ45_CORCC|nr:cytochrome P450 reductase 2 [Corynespora cassiicola Philippines]
MDSFNIPIDISELQSTLNPLLQSLEKAPILQNLKPATTADGVALFLFFLSAIGYLSRGRVWDKPDPNYKVYFERPQVLDGASSSKTAATRNIAQRLDEGNYQCVIFWGSQSGTSERFAETLASECASYFGINTLSADLSDYDAESITAIPSGKFAIFILSTYGEGDPSDNTAGLWDWIKKIKDNQVQVNGLRYLALGLGNSNYKYYNRVLDVVADAFDAAGATALIPRQKADDANGGTEEDFQSWKDDVFSLFRSIGYEEKDVEYQPTIDIQFSPGAKEVESSVSVHHQQTNTSSSIIPLSVRNSRELFTAGDRNCLHLELDLAHHEVGYKTGDHLGVWPCNPEEEIEDLLSALGLQSRRKDVFTATALNEATGKPKVPSPTSLEAAFRHHLEICAPVSRKTFLHLAQFAPTAEAKATLLHYGKSREQYERLTSSTHITFARLLHLASPSAPWTSLPLSFVIENLLALQPRYYSISSSSVISPRRIAITALVVNKPLAGEQQSVIPGLASNYLLSATKLPSRSALPTPSFQHSGQSTPDSRRIYAHVRKSKFKLPITSSTPLVLISAGTGFAPFRAFLAERAKLHAIGKPVGKMLVFFGCRSAESDFIYRDELERLKETLGDKLEIVTAFSRDGGRRVYVQDRVAECAGRVMEMLDAGANMYICGKASMAREVDMKIEEAAVRQKGMGESEVKAWTDALKKRGKWRADVWG